MLASLVTCLSVACAPSPHAALWNPGPPVREAKAAIRREHRHGSFGGCQQRERVTVCAIEVRVGTARCDRVVSPVWDEMVIAVDRQLHARTVSAWAMWFRLEC